MAHAKPLLAVLTLCVVAATMRSLLRRRPSHQPNGATTAATRGSPDTLPSIKSIATTSRVVRIAWRRPAVNDKMIAAFPDTRPNAYLRATPIMIDGVLYTQDAHGLVIALDGETGRTIWEQPFGPGSGRCPRCVNSWG